MKYFVVAGERSGDLHGGNLIKELKKIDKDASFAGFGGDEMIQQGVDVKVHYADLAFMGFKEVLTNLSRIRGYIRQCKEEITKFSPDVIILIDYGGFNMKIARFGKSLGIPVHYYITPKVWAWNQKRALKLKAHTDRMYVILPFEKEFFRRFNVEVDYVGNPVLDAIKSYQPVDDKALPENFVAVLPGSRKQELKYIIPTLSELVKELRDIQFVISTVGNLDTELYNPFRNLPNVSLYEKNSYDLLAKAKAAIVTSGTATLETALWNVPQIVVYKTSTISYMIAKNLIKIPFISLVNLIADKEVVKELIQEDFNVENVKRELLQLIDNKHCVNQILINYSSIRSTLDVGSASKNTAGLINRYLKN